jgi:hypothetical protein
MIYRAKAVTQQDGGPLANSNCRMASAAIGLDFDTLGKKTSTGSKMRGYSGDPAGGTTATDAVRAWDHYDEVLNVRNGETWDGVVASLLEGRLVHLDVWAATCGGPCCSSAVGHTIAVAPEKSGSRWLTADPWCKPAKWVWWSEAKLRAASEEWADRCGWRSATLGGPRDIRELTEERLAEIIKELMTLWDPSHPLLPEDDDYEPGETSGGKPVLWTRTAAHPDTSGGDMSIRAPESLSSDYVYPVSKGQSFFADAALTEKLGEFSSARDQRYVGVVIEEDARAIIVVTSKPYDDGIDRPTVVYVRKSEKEPIDTGNERDAAWREWLDNDSGAPDKES